MAIQQEVEAHGFIFELKQCNISGRSITFHFLIINNGPDTSLEIYSEDSRLFDSSGNEHIGDRAQLGSDRGTSPEMVLVSGVPTKAMLHFGSVSPQITTITLLELACQGNYRGGEFKVQFAKEVGKKGVTISGEASMKKSRLIMAL